MPVSSLVIPAKSISNQELTKNAGPAARIPKKSFTELTFSCYVLPGWHLAEWPGRAEGPGRLARYTPIRRTPPVAALAGVIHQPGPVRRVATTSHGRRGSARRLS